MMTSRTGVLVLGAALAILASAYLLVPAPAPEWEETGGQAAGPGVREDPASLSEVPRLARYDATLPGRLALVLTSPETQGDVGRIVASCKSATAADIGALREAALEAEDPLVVGNAIRALGRLGAVLHDKDLLGLLEDPRARVRDEMILALGASGQEEALEVLGPLLRSPSLQVRALTLRALGSIPGPRAAVLAAAVVARPDASPTEVALARRVLAGDSGTR